MMAATEKFREQFEIDWSKLPKPFQNNTSKQVLEQEMKDLIVLRGVYRTGFSKIESCNFKDVLVAGQQVLPVNVYKILDNIAYTHADYSAEVDNVLSPADWKTMKDRIKSRLPYTHFNEMCEKNGMKVPDHVKISLTLMNMSVDMALSYKNIFNNTLKFNCKNTTKCFFILFY